MSPGEQKGVLAILAKLARAAGAIDRDASTPQGPGFEQHIGKPFNLGCQNENIGLDHFLPGLLRAPRKRNTVRSEEHTSELQSLMRISYAVFCLTKKTTYTNTNQTRHITR